MPKILIVDDEKPLRDTLARWFRSQYECLTAPDAATALRLIGENPDLTLMISDVRMPPEGDRSGVELLKKAKAANPDMAAILLTAYGTVPLAVEAMQDGADDFFQKPITDLAAFELRVAKAVSSSRLAREAAALPPAESDSGLGALSGTSQAMERVYRLIRKVAPTQASVLIEGPSGTGKELVARAVHDLSTRAKGPFVALNCAALTPTLLESELFGYRRGAFTGADTKQDKIGRFEAANGGTLFLDEIGEIDMATQVKLLRVLESRIIQRVGDNTDIPVDFRLVAATNRNLPQRVAEGAFREDLFYRLDVVDIHMPALKDRPGDIALLANRFLDEFVKKNSGTVTGIAPETMTALEAYDWPGNVRQLRNVIEKMVVLASGKQLQTEDLPPEIMARPTHAASDVRATAPAPAVSPDAPTASAATASTNLADIEKTKILETLSACRGNKTKAAEQLGISRRTLHRKLVEWKIDA